MSNLYSITTSQATVIAPLQGAKPVRRQLAAHARSLSVVRNAGAGRELVIMRWGMPPPAKFNGPPVTNIRNNASPHWQCWLKPESRQLPAQVDNAQSLAFRTISPQIPPSSSDQ